MKYVTALLAGLIFGLGLTTSQMVNPDKVINFLDITSSWDASLMLVMGAALVVFGISYHWFIKSRKRAVCGAAISLPNSTLITKELLIGASIFGIGWGLAGICPGPAVTNIVGGEPKIYGFIVMMIIGMKASSFLSAKAQSKS